MIVKQHYLLLLWSVWKAYFQGVLLLIVCSCLMVPSISSSAELDKATLKALYTYKFGKFSKWPENKLNVQTDEFKYCILGALPFPQAALNMLIGKTVQEVTLSIDVFSSGLVAEEVLTSCHILYISQSEKHRLAIILERLKNVAVLTVSDIDHFSAKGGMVTLAEGQDQIHFQMNVQVLNQAGLSMSSKVLELAEIVETGESL